jgi:dihydrofolate reductase
MTQVVAVLAVDEHLLLGAQGSLPWRLPGDLKRFREVTTPWPVLMGRRTWESIGRPLPGRDNWVITRQPGFEAPGAHVAHSLEAALAANAGRERVMIIGGGDIYAAAWPWLTHLHMTVVHSAFPGDTWLKGYDEAQWVTERETRFEADERNEWACTVYERVRHAAHPALPLP